MQTKFEKLFQPGRIGTLEIKNRIVMPPMGTGLSGVWGEVTDALVEWYATRARGGPGLVFVQAAYAATAIDPLRMPQTQLRADDDIYAPGLSCLAEVIHDGGARAGIQISAGLGAQARGGPWVPGRQFIEETIAVSPSGISSPEVMRPARPLEVAEIKKIVELVGKAAARVKRAGFDIIELHAHAGHLIAQFMSPLFNKRTDEYGGSFDGRMRFLDEIMDSIRKNVGPDFPVGIKYSIDELIEGGRGMDEGLLIAKRMEKAGVNFITVSIGVHGARMPAVPPMYHPEGTFVSVAEALKKAVGIPVILPGRLDDPPLAERVLEEGKTDFIAWGRALIADPNMPLKVANGEFDQVRRCIACNTCLHTMWLVRPIRCTVNPVAGRECEFNTLQPAEKPKKVLVVGAGPAGMEAARVAALRGHQVTLWEKSRELGGGQLKLATVPPHKDILKRIPDYYWGVFKRLPNLSVEMGKEATVRGIVAQRPDAVIVATGATTLVPDVPGINDPKVVTAFDVLAGKAKVGQKVVVAGGGSVGCETANLLAQQGKEVTIVEMLDRIGSDVEAWTWNALRRELSDHGVVSMTQVKLQAVTPRGLMIVDAKGEPQQLFADSVVLAVGAKPVDQLFRKLSGKVKEVHIIGDARQPRKLRDAIADGHVVGWKL